MSALFHFVAVGCRVSAKGIARVSAPDESTARRQLEELGCLVLSMRGAENGEFEITVALPGASANALAYAVADLRIKFAALPT